MTLQNSVAVTIAHGTESVWGTPATAGGTSKYIRRVQSTLAPTRDAFQSNEARIDQQISDMRLGTFRAAGSIEGELSLTTFDDWIASALRTTWAAGVSKSQAEFTSMAADNVTSKFTVAASTWAAQGFRVGDVIRFTGLSDVDNNGKNFQITSLSTVDAFVTPAPDTMGADTAFTVAVVGFKAVQGVEQHSYTIEQRNPEQDVSERFDGMRLNTMTVRIPPSGMAGVTFDWMGKQTTYLTGANSPYFTAITAAPSTSLLAGPNGFLWLNALQRVVVTGLDFSVTHQMADTPVVGSLYVPEIFYGSAIITGNVSAYFESEALVNAFLAETEMDLMCRLDAPSVGGAASEFLSFNMQRVKLTGHSKTIGTTGGLISSFPFQALLKGTATGYDSSSLVIQRSL